MGLHILTNYCEIMGETNKRALDIETNVDYIAPVK
jgi:hypothetical protein